MTREEWINEFQVLNGRKPTEVEIQNWEKILIGNELAGKRFKFNFEKLIKIGLIILIAIFGYIVGYLFT